jgi:hypothetical protein
METPRPTYYIVRFFAILLTAVVLGIALFSMAFGAINSFTIILLVAGLLALAASVWVFGFFKY